jgi:hypothetical protein
VTGRAGSGTASRAAEQAAGAPDRSDGGSVDELDDGIHAFGEEGRIAGRRQGGRAAWVPPTSRLGRRRRRQEWGRRGFVPLSPGRAKLRHRILPRTVIGISFMLLSLGVGAAFSGAAFYAYYSNRLAENEQAVGRFVEGFDQQFTDAAGSLDEMRVDAVETIRSELAPLEPYVTDASGVVTLPTQVGPSVWTVETQDDAGRSVVGSAFAIVGHRGGTALVTSLSVVSAATNAPAPAIELVKDNRRITAELWGWDDQRDLALLVVDDVIPTLPMATERDRVDAVGRSVFAISGVGGQGASAAPGVLIDQSSAGLQHTVPLGTLYVGGPLVDGSGQVLGVVSAEYQPLGVDPGAIGQAPDIDGLCSGVLRCSETDQSIVASARG